MLLKKTFTSIWGSTFLAFLSTLICQDHHHDSTVLLMLRRRLVATKLKVWNTIVYIWYREYAIHCNGLARFIKFHSIFTIIANGKEKEKWDCKQNFYWRRWSALLFGDNGSGYVYGYIITFTWKDAIWMGLETRLPRYFWHNAEESIGLEVKCLYMQHTWC